MEDQFYEISSDERCRRERAVRFARASIALEGFIPSHDEEARARLFIEGKIDVAQFVAGINQNPTKSDL